jgi:predicted Zn-dependent peptidase
MSVEVTRLSTGLAVVTDAMPHLETASLGVWVGSGSRDERPTSTASRICSSTWRSRARRGARRDRSRRRSSGGRGFSMRQPRSR